MSIKNEFYATMRNMGIEPFNEHEYMTNLKKGTDEATEHTFLVLCEAEVERDILASYAHQSDEAYDAWVEADRVATAAEAEYNEWLNKQRYVDDDYYRFIEELDIEMYNDAHGYKE